MLGSGQILGQNLDFQKNVTVAAILVADFDNPVDSEIVDTPTITFRSPYWGSPVTLAQFRVNYSSPPLSSGGPLLVVAWFARAQSRRTFSIEEKYQSVSF